MMRDGPRSHNLVKFKDMVSLAVSIGRGKDKNDLVQDKPISKGHRKLSVSEDNSSIPSLGKTRGVFHRQY